ncbi:hypothetical protein ACFFUO_14490 [Vibrio artabrorum]|uniref:HEAT repeat domain-containing protein n=1 Tax=Vibrio artabrorum TaxID=446374 RepID=A0ABT8CJD4_9VIBR|nr:hypothetical protein [Vibrio artabrorum]MDN3700679.1 hypothetical protein [Vibrio artabrorum]
MRHGLLSSLLLSTSLLMSSVGMSYATEMSPHTVESWLENDQVKLKTTELFELVVHDEVDSLRFALERLTFPQQEVTRYQLLKKLEQQKIVLTSKMALFIEQQLAITPTYQVLERGDGYEFTIPAFDYPSIANRLIKQWRQDQNTQQFVLDAEKQDLDLKMWLSGNEYQVQTRESLLIKELDSLSPEAVDYLTKQLTTSSIVSWLPSTEVVVRLAQVSQDPEVYNILWRMKADYYSQAELVRLAETQQVFALEQVMAATKNPRLKDEAITLLAKVKPLSEEVKQFLVSRMAIADEAPLVARELAKQGHTRWLQDLVNDNPQVKSSLIKQALP